MLARNGAVTLDTNTITRPQCAAGTGASPSASAAPTATASATPNSTPSSNETSQVTDVPEGGVDTGSSSGGLGAVGSGVVVLSVVGGATAVVLRRRHRSV